MAYPSYATLNNGYKQQRNHHHHHHRHAVPQTNPRVSSRRSLHRNMNNNQKIADIHLLLGTERPRLKIATNGYFVSRNNAKQPRDVFKKPMDPPKAKRQPVLMETSFLNVYPEEYSFVPPSPVIQVPHPAPPSSPPPFSPPRDSAQLINSLLNKHDALLRSNTMDYLHEVKQYILRAARKNRRKPILYNLQQEAPKPKRIVCLFPTDNKPQHYGREFHGAIPRDEADTLLAKSGEGSYLVRESQRAPGSFTLGLRLNNSTLNFRLYYDGKHYVAEKRFESLHDLVADGLITLYVEAKAADYIKQMESEPIYEKHAKYATIREKRISNGSVGPLIKGSKGPLHSDQADSGTGSTECLDNAVTSVSYEKAHNFKIHTFKGLNWCEYCGNFMWGLIAQGVRCTDCGLSTHKQCSKRVPPDCTPNRRLIKRVYGVDLTTLVKAHGTMRSIVVDKCIEELELRGLDMEGLYRVPGMQDDMDLCRQRFDKDGANAKISAKDFPDINVISGALKMYLRQLPIPLVPFEMYDRFMGAAKITDATERLKATHEAMQELHNTKPAHYHTLKHLINHLNRVVQHKEHNKMNAENVGIVFGPTLLREANDQSIMDNLYLLQYQKKVVEVMVENPDIIFDK